MKRLIVLLSALLLAVMPVQAKAQEQGNVTAKCYTEAGSVEGLDKLTDADKTPVDTIVNRPDGLKLPDTGSREAMVLMYIASILLSCSMLAFYSAGRTRGPRHEDK